MESGTMGVVGRGEYRTACGQEGVGIGSYWKHSIYVSVGEV